MAVSKKIKCIIDIILVALILLMLSFISFVLNVFCFNNAVNVSSSSEPTYTIVIDPGHGGGDGGAENINIKEKDLNLDISLKIAEILELYNVNVVLTRDSDNMLAEDTSVNKKIDDLKNRVKIVEDYELPIFVSIHMNKFPIEKYRGLQVFYSPNNRQSEALAITVQKNVNKQLDPDNLRNVKKSDSSIYVLDRTFCPSVLIECGFLSNNYDIKNLTNEAYQTQLAFVIANSIIEYIEL